MFEVSTQQKDKMLIANLFILTLFGLFTFKVIANILKLNSAILVFVFFLFPLTFPFFFKTWLQKQLLVFHLDLFIVLFHIVCFISYLYCISLYIVFLVIILENKISIYNLSYPTNFVILSFKVKY